MFFWISLGMVVLALLVLALVACVRVPRYRRSARQLMAAVDEIPKSLGPLTAQIGLLQQRLRPDTRISLDDEGLSLTSSEIEEAQRRRVMAARAARAKYRRLRRARS